MQKGKCADEEEQVKKEEQNFWSISMMWSRWTIQYKLELQLFKHTTFFPLHRLLWKLSIQPRVTFRPFACSVLRGQNYVPVIKLQPYRLSLPKGSVSFDDRATLEVTGISTFIHQGSFEDAWNHQLWWGRICNLQVIPSRAELVFF